MFSLKIEELIHFSTASITGIILVLIFNNFWLLPISIFLGFLIDFDHLVDYFFCFFKLEKKIRRQNLFNIKYHIKNFFNPQFYMLKTRKIIVFLHGWEWVVIFWLIGRWLGTRIGWPGLKWIVIAYILHLTWDQISCAGTKFSYFFTYRLCHKFSREAYDGIKK